MNTSTKSKQVPVNVLALDLGGTMGWALRVQRKEGYGVIHTGSVQLKNKGFEGSGMRYYNFQQWLHRMHKHDIGLVIFEEVKRHEGTDAAHVFGGYMATLGAFCEHWGIPYRGVGVAKIKKAATGNGNASKEMVMRAAVKAGFEPIDDNEADAIGLMTWAIENGLTGPGRPV